MTEANDPAVIDDRAKQARTHLVFATLAVNAAVFVLSRPVFIMRQLHGLIGVVFLAGALMGIRRDDDDTERYGVRLGGVFPGGNGDPRSLVRALWEARLSAARELAIAAAIAALVLPLYTALWPFFNQPIGPRHFELTPERWLDIAAELLAVAFTEEMFFRGYVHTRVADFFKVDAHTRVPSELARVLVLTSALFALTHVVVDPTLARAAVFFPGLLLGLVRAWRGGIGAAIALHAAFNLWERYLEGR